MAWCAAVQNPAYGYPRDVSVTPEEINEAAAAIEGDIVRTPTLASTTLSELTGARVAVKFENLQFTGSFKDRGAANHLRCLSGPERERGLVALSAGNHAQGLAYHAGRLGLKATIVMPETAPFNKVTNTEALGAEVVQFGQTFADARTKLEELREEFGYCYVPPFDDLAIIAGQGTVGLEMLTDQPELDVLLVPVGGGGLISGVSIAAKHLRPGIEIIGVQVEAYSSVASRVTGHWDEGTGADTLADGIAVKSPGEITMSIIDRLVDDMIVVSEEGTEQAIALFLEIEKTVAEGAGAVGLAALLENPERFADRRVGIVLSGGNIDVRVLASVLMRGLVRTDRISSLRVRVGDLPGQLAPIVGAIAASGANIVEIDHRRMFDPISARSTNIDLVIETRDGSHRDEVIAAIAALGHDVDLIS